MLLDSPTDWSVASSASISCAERFDIRLGTWCNDDTRFANICVIWAVNCIIWSWTAFDTCSCTVLARVFWCSILSTSSWATLDFIVSTSALQHSKSLIIVDCYIPAGSAFGNSVAEVRRPPTVSAHVRVRSDEVVLLPPSAVASESISLTSWKR